MRIEPLTSALTTVAAALHSAAGFHEIWDAGAFASLLPVPGTGGFLAMAGDEPTGLVLFRVAADEAEILTICTLPERRHAGIGHALLDAAIDAASKAGACRLYLEVAVDNLPAIALYERSGFRNEGHRPAYYRRETGSVDALILGRDI